MEWATRYGEMVVDTCLVAPALPEDRVKDILVLVNTRIPIVKYRDAHTYDM